MKTKKNSCDNLLENTSRRNYHQYALQISKKWMSNELLVLYVVVNPTSNTDYRSCV